MNRDFVLSIRLPRRPMAFVTVGAIVGAAALAWAMVPNTFATGDTLAAQKLNDDFNALVDLTSAQTVGGVKTFSANAVFKGSVGIGTASPQAVLAVQNGSHPALNFSPTASPSSGLFYISTQGGEFGSDSGMVLNVPSGRAFEFADNGGDVVIIDPSGNLGVGTAPDSKLTVNGSADKPGGGSWGTFSDERLKDIEGPFTTGLDAIARLQPVRYQYKKDNALGIRSPGEHIGFSAQAVEKVIPEAVRRNDKGYLVVDNDPILWTMLNATKELRAVERTDQERIARLERDNAELRRRLEAMERRMASVPSRNDRAAAW